jgi:hypothetical protein
VQERHHSFGAGLVGQIYEADLTGTGAGASTGSAE